MIAANFYTSPLGLGLFLGGIAAILIVGTIQRHRGQLPYQREERERSQADPQGPPASDR
jgi:hypothetical protein